MNYDFEDCYDEVNFLEIDIEDKVLKDIEKRKQKIKKRNKKIKNKDKDE